MANTYYIKLDGIDNPVITGTNDTPQSITFANLTDINGNELTEGFSVIPFVAIKKLPTEKREAVVSNITKTGCQIAMSNYGYVFTSSGKYLLIIRG